MPSLCMHYITPPRSHSSGENGAAILPSQSKWKPYFFTFRESSRCDVIGIYIARPCTMRPARADAHVHAICEAIQEAICDTRVHYKSSSAAEIVP